ncbi:MAG: hypothetical protein QFB87_00540 [Patescibacteria group bacterium]|nr:hypothetical protein [Patescibacteria group bacterium]
MSPESSANPAPTPEDFTVQNWIHETQLELNAELLETEKSRPTHLDPLEDQIEFGKKVAIILGKNELLAKLTEEAFKTPTFTKPQ